MQSSSPDNEHPDDKADHRRNNTPALPLAIAGAGREVEIIDIAGGRGLAHHVAEMGLHPGSKVKIISGCGHGPVIVAVNGSRFAVGRGMAYKIMVRP